VQCPTRYRGMDEPHILDLVISDDTIVENIEMLGPLGKSDHAVLEIHCSLDVCYRHFTDKYNYIKGDYVGLRTSLVLDLKSLFATCGNDV